MPRTDLGPERAHPLPGTHLREEAPAFGRHALAAHLVAREVLCLQQQHVVPAPREQAGEPRAGRAAAHHDDVGARVAHAALTRHGGDGEQPIGEDAADPRPPGSRRPRSAARSSASAKGAPDRDQAVVDAQRALEEPREDGAAEEVGDERAPQVGHDERAAREAREPAQQAGQLVGVEVVQEQRGQSRRRSSARRRAAGARRPPRARCPRGASRRCSAFTSRTDGERSAAAAAPAGGRARRPSRSPRRAAGRPLGRWGETARDAGAPRARASG